MGYFFFLLIKEFQTPPPAPIQTLIGHSQFKTCNFQTQKLTIETVKTMHTLFWTHKNMNS